MLVVGNLPCLGQWNPALALELRGSGDGFMEAQVEIMDSLEARNFQYKFLLQHGHGNIEWEAGDNRAVDLEQQLQRAVSLSKENIQLVITL